MPARIVVGLGDQTVGTSQSDTLAASLTWFTILATLAVALATLYQAYAARQTVQEMKASRKLEQTPHLHVFLNIEKVVLVFLMFANIGKAAAVGIQAKAIFKKDGETIEERPYNAEVILPLDGVQLILPETHFDNMLTKFTHIDVTGTYQDVFGQSYTINQSIDVKEFVNHIKKAKIYGGSQIG